MKRMLGFLYFLFCKIFFKFYCPIKVYGYANLPKTPFILCSNHNSHMDTPALMIATGIPFSRFGMVAAKDYFFDNRWRKLFGMIMNLIPVNRKVSRTSLMNDISACQHFVKHKEGYLIIYPEGTRSMTGEMQTFKRGPAMIAQQLAMPLVPAYIEGTFESMGKGQFFPKSKKIHVKFGKPIIPSEDKKQVTKLLENEIKILKEWCIR